MKRPEFFGSSTFFRRTGLNASDLKTLEERGILRPIKTDSGHRCFTADDVAVGQTWAKFKPRRNGVRKVGRK